VNGIVFHSKKEANRYKELLLLEKAKQISNIRCQVTFEIYRKIVTEEGVTIHAKNYIADFVYYDELIKKETIEDVKGYSTREFRTKWSQMMQRYKEYVFLLT
jgi:hypothetical protein